ncbi:hypothetical protein PoB_004515800 [Plakobranchus ocellatus]|uniref:Uncharacterized protein n=1 Tax=Plakobranchus ocellatus TaxID=259542 RepID=A0AAV4BGD1_9GAST|nr:hypothetical protein PoB_004515800 [Plakobranchus ocellatus]
MEAVSSGIQPAKRFCAQKMIEMLENNKDLPSVLSEESNESYYSLSSSDSDSDFDIRARSRSLSRPITFGEVPSASNKKGKGKGFSRVRAAVRNVGLEDDDPEVLHKVAYTTGYCGCSK